MPNFESELKNEFENDSEIEIRTDNTSSYDDIDFCLRIGDKDIYVDAKEKKTTYRPAWVEFSGIDERSLFILDELGVRKLFQHFPNFFVVIKNCMDSKYYVFSSFDLLCIDRIRLDRKIVKEVEQRKGKWLISLMWEKELFSLNDVSKFIKEQTSLLDNKLKELGCHKVGNSEVFLLDGKYSRIPKYWKKDVSEK